MSRIRNYTSQIDSTEAPILQDITKVMTRYGMTINDLLQVYSKLDTISKEKPVNLIINEQDITAPLLTTSEVI